MFDSAMQFFNETMNNAVGKTATYSRGQDSFSCTVILGGSGAEIIGPDDGVTVQTRMRDILIQAADFDFENFRQPKKSDLITVDNDRYAVVVRSGIGAWRWSDHQKTKLRIFVKDIKD